MGRPPRQRVTSLESSAGSAANEKVHFTPDGGGGGGGAARPPKRRSPKGSGGGGGGSRGGGEGSGGSSDADLYAAKLDKGLVAAEAEKQSMV